MDKIKRLLLIRLMCSIALSMLKSLEDLTLARKRYLLFELHSPCQDFNKAWREGLLWLVDDLFKLNEGK